MDYSSVIKYLNATYSRCATDASYYTNINSWLEWYKGYVKDFHTRNTSNGITYTAQTSLHLNMGKRVCEDWASSLLNEKVDITISAGVGEKRSNAFVQGTKGNGGVLGSNNFNVSMSNAIEKMFALGTSAIVVDVNNILVDEFGNIVSGTDGVVKLRFYDATSIFPLSAENGVVTEVSLVSETTIKTEKYYTVSTHVLELDGYVIYNEILDKTYAKVKSDMQVQPIVRTKSFKPMFQIIKPNTANNIDLNSPLGLSVYGDAIDVLKSVDNAYDDCMHEIESGRRVTFMSQAMLLKDSDGKPIPPQDSRQTDYQFVGNDIADTALLTLNNSISSKSAVLNTVELNLELQNQLNCLSRACGLGNRYYQTSSGVVTTATEYTGSNNDFMRNAKKHSHMLENAIKNIISQVLWVGKNILGLNVNVDAKIDIKVSDGIVEDDSKEKESDRQDVKDGIMSKAEYRSKWYGETEEEAQLKIDSFTAIPPNGVASVVI